MKKKYLLNFIAIAMSQLFWAQTTETFETETAGGTSFTDNGQVFNITTQAGGTFDIYYNILPYGWNGTAVDNYFIDNTGSGTFNVPVSFTISSAGSTPFNIKQFWVYLSQSNLTGLGQGGSLTVVGKLGSNTKFTATKSIGFNVNSLINNGYTLIDFTTFGGTDNSNVNIDQLVISTTGSFAYCALDAMTWKFATNLSNKDFVKKSDFVISPNPAKDLLMINSDKAAEFQICNPLGQVVKTFNVDSGANSIDVSEMIDGIYFIKSKNNISEVQKIIIKH
ncbi:T9SS type A sorting domain-containing protein [Flavobacterium sp. NG2]|uniref:T9SS type A sorting domain-containing protein n=1 Tax=Flavobacterium sp. NG2 TaxID=3097547 RepID=UPI002A82AAEA|nr:T9SS type A sorting domain-containing protein [Flavobacterium sp. NG2]WPR72944.1 T9SS type A sorting domain-containing protein [Flavobacterium sp. NG2]